MKPSELDPDEVIQQAHRRALRIRELELKLEHERGLRASDAAWLVRNTTLMRSTIAQVLGMSRVTLNAYLADQGITDEYLAQVRKLQEERGISLFDAADLQIAPAQDE